MTLMHRAFAVWHMRGLARPILHQYQAVADIYAPQPCSSFCRIENPIGCARKTIMAMVLERCHQRIHSVQYRILDL